MTYSSADAPLIVTILIGSVFCLGSMAMVAGGFFLLDYVLTQLLKLRFRYRRTDRERKALRSVVVGLWLGDRDARNACFEVMEAIDPDVYQLFCKDQRAAVNLVDPEMGSDDE